MPGSTASGIAIESLDGFAFGHGVVRDENDRVVTHVLHLPLDPAVAVTAAALVVLPLIARLQGAEVSGPTTLRATWDAPQPATTDLLRAIPATLDACSDGRLRVRPVVTAGPTDLPDLALADGLALFPANQGPWHGGEIIEFAPFAPWPGRAED
jgi:molybdopterin biosynthesis enzyme